MRTNSLNALLILASLLLIGCDTNSGSGPLGPPRKSALMAPFAGKWEFNFEKTLAAQKAAGATDDQKRTDAPSGEMRPALLGGRSNVRIGFAAAGSKGRHRPNVIPRTSGRCSAYRTVTPVACGATS